MRPVLMATAGPSHPALVTAERRKQSRVGQMRIAIAGSTSDLSAEAAAADAAHSNVIVVQCNQYAYAAAVKAINPAVKVYSYKNFGTTKTSRFSDGTSSVGVPKDVLDSSLTLKHGGTEITLTAYSYLYPVDVADAGYIDQWDGIVGPELIANGFDGVMLDDVNPYLHTSLTSDLYPDDASYQAAVQAGMRRLIPKLRARGLSVLPNIGAWFAPGYTGAGDAIADICGSGIIEQFGSYNVPPTIQNRVDFATQLRRAIRTQKNGGEFFGLGHGVITDTQVIRNTIAAGWLAVEGPGRLHIGIADANYELVTPQHADLSYNPGLPTEDAQNVSTHVWKRQFTNGQVWINLNTAATYDATFGGTYSGSGLTSQTGTTIALQTALLLTPG